MTRPHRPPRRDSPEADLPIIDFAEMQRRCETSAAIGGFFGNLLAGFLKGTTDKRWYHLWSRDDDMVPADAAPGTGDD